MNNPVPGYVKLHHAGLLDQRADALMARMSPCMLCPRHCLIDRLAGEKGYCRLGTDMVVHGADAHFGEEPMLVGTRGSGTIFFSHCNLGCVYCQNFETSQHGLGQTMTSGQLAKMMLALQAHGCANINLVTPTHVIPHIVKALSLAANEGLSRPVIYNSGGYDDVATLQLLADVIDIYMPDMKYGDNEAGLLYSGVKAYTDHAKAALLEMHRQVGDLKLDAQGLAFKGLLVRHLVLPNGLAGSKDVLTFIANQISQDTVVNIMSQYHPAYKARTYEMLSRWIDREEIKVVHAIARQLGLARAMIS